MKKYLEERLTKKR